MSGYSVTPLVKKLGLKEGMRVTLINPPINYFDLLGDPFPEFEEAEVDLDFVHLFTNNESEFQSELNALKQKIKPNGVVWVSWYKKAAKKPTELTEDIIRNYARGEGWVDVKVCAVNDDWSGLKLVIPVKDR